MLVQNIIIKGTFITYSYIIITNIKISIGFCNMSNKNIRKIIADNPEIETSKIMQHYGDLFTKVREKKYTNQKMVAEFLGVSQPLISQIEAGKKLPTDELDFKITSEWGISVESVIKQLSNDEIIDPESEQIINLIKTHHTSLSHTAKNLLLADVTHIIQRDLGSSLHDIESDKLSTNFRQYGWSFVLRKLMTYLRSELNGVVTYDRLVITRRHPKLQTYVESFVISRHMVWWNHWDNKNAINRTAGIHKDKLFEIFNNEDPMGDVEDMVITDHKYKDESHIFTSYNTSLWFPIVTTENEEALVIFTRNKNHQDGDFSVNDYEYIYNVINNWIPENVN